MSLQETNMQKAADELSAAAQAYAKVSPTKDGARAFNDAWNRLTRASEAYAQAYQGF